MRIRAVKDGKSPIFDLTENLRDLGNSKHIKVESGGKTYYGRIATNKTEIPILIANTRYYLQYTPAYFGDYKWEKSYGGSSWQERFFVYLPKGKYNVTWNTRNDHSYDIVIPNSTDVEIVITFEKRDFDSRISLSFGNYINEKRRPAGKKTTRITIRRTGA